jgi:hypothetical protein
MIRPSYLAFATARRRYIAPPETNICLRLKLQASWHYLLDLANWVSDAY